MEKARAFTDEDRTQRRCMVVIYMEISNMLRAECETLSIAPLTQRIAELEKENKNDVLKTHTTHRTLNGLD